MEQMSESLYRRSSLARKDHTLPDELQFRIDEFGGANAPLCQAPAQPDRLAFAAGSALPRLALLAGQAGRWARLWGDEAESASWPVSRGALRPPLTEVPQASGGPPSGQVWRSYYYAGPVRMAVRVRTQTSSVVRKLLN
jgi:hypothetical protein